MINLKIDTNPVQSMFASVKDLEQDLITQGYTYFKSITPIGNPSTWKSKPPAGYTPGNARRSTVKAQDGINANYPYAARLDEGWSRQAPRGMSDPTIAYMQQVFDKLIADADK